MRQALIWMTFLVTGCSGAQLPARVVSADQVETRWAPPGMAKVEILAVGQNAFVGKLIMDPGGQVPENVDPTEEYIHVLQGHGVVTIDGVEYDVQPGTTIYMPPGVAVSYRNGDETFEPP